MQGLSYGYSVEVDRVDAKLWYGMLETFGDANIYQTWAYDAVRFGKDKISHLIVNRRNETVAAVQARIVKIPVCNAGIAYVFWGPLWKEYNSKHSLDGLREVFVAMRQEYVERRGLFLRVIPNEVEQREDDLQRMLGDLGFSWRRSDYRTLYLGLDRPLEEIRSDMSKNWRKHLNKAEKKALMVVEGTDSSLFDRVERLYRETILRKRFVPGIKIEEYRKLQESLPDRFKMHIAICESDGRPMAALVGSAIGEVGIELIAATGDDGLESGGSYLLRWKMIEYLKSRGCHYYNLNGINPERNPGGYQFKSGLCGKDALDLRFIGTFEACKNPLSRVAVRVGEGWRLGYKKMIKIMGKPHTQD